MEDRLRVSTNLEQVGENRVCRSFPDPSGSPKTCFLLARFDRLEKLFMSTAKKMGGKRRKKKGDGGSSLLSGLSGANSGGSDDSGGSGDS